MVLLLEIFEIVTEELIDLTMAQCNLYLHKKRRYFLCLQKTNNRFTRDKLHYDNH